MIRKNLIKTLSLAMATMLAVMTIGCGAKEADNEAAAVEETAEEETLTDSMAKTLGTSSEDAGKVETVYVSADANGDACDVVVSEWLKNGKSATELSDKTELKDIVNVKGDETYKDNGDGTLTWDAEGSDIYYQGVTDKKLPVNMKITYYLDGKEIQPDELAGKSGKVKIRFEYENTDKQTVDVDGKSVDVYTPFVMMSGMMLDGDKFSNVEISNGKVISDGGNYIVMGVAMPGLKDSLDISQDKWDEIDDEELENKLSNSFEVTADTASFELGMTITMASSDILADFGFSDMTGSSKIDDIKDDMNELNDGSNSLVDGSKELKDGTGELRDGVSELYDGTKELKDGAKEINDGTKQFYDGVVKYTDGAQQIRNGTEALNDGVSAVKDGSSALRKGMEEANLVDSANALAQGTEALDGGVKQIAQMASSMSELLAAASQLSNVKNAYLATEAYLLGSGNHQQGAIAAATLGVDKATLDEVIAVGKPALEQSNPAALTPVVHKVKKTSNAQYGVVALSTGDDGNGNDNGDDVNTDNNNGNDNTDNSGDDNSANNSNAGGGDNSNGNSGDGNDNSGNDVNGGNRNGGNENVENLNGNGNNNNSGAGSNPVNNVDVPSGNNVDGSGSANAAGVQGNDLQQNNQQQSNSQQNAGVIENNMNVTNFNVTGNNGGIDPAILGTSLNQTQGSEAGYYTAEQIDEIKRQAGEAALAEFGDQVMTQAADRTRKIAAYSGYLAQTKAILIFMRDAKLDTLANLDPAVLQNLSQLDALTQGADQVANGNAQLAKGIDKLYQGTVKLDDGIGELKSGSAELMKGANTLTDNNKDLVDGAGKLYDATKSLDDGVGELNDGVGELNDGAGKLDDGVQELVDGMIKFDKEGIKKIYEVFDGDLADFSDRLSAIEKAGENYSTFGGASEDVDSSVKFIIKTDSIK